MRNLNFDLKFLFIFGSSGSSYLPSFTLIPFFKIYSEVDSSAQLPENLFEFLHTLYETTIASTVQTFHVSVNSLR